MSEPLELRGPDDLRARPGLAIGPSDWVELSPERVALFAEVTGDPQEIHLNDNAARLLGFSGAIVHGYFLLSLIAHVAPLLWRFADAPTAINYGANRVRFIKPVLAGDSVRFAVEITQIDDKTEYTLVHATYRCESRELGETVMVADTLVAFPNGQKSDEN
jgi:acyl dehydratase